MQFGYLFLRFVASFYIIASCFFLRLQRKQREAVEATEDDELMEDQEFVEEEKPRKKKVGSVYFTDAEFLFIY